MILAILIIAVFCVLAWQMLRWIDRLLDYAWERRYLRRRPR